MEHNIDIVIFTNGTIINKSLIDKIQEYPKISFVIQVLSINNNTYEKITGERNMFQVIENNIQLLKENNIKYTIQLLIGSFNELELHTMKNYFSDNRTIISYIYPTNEYTGSTTETKEKLIDYIDKSINVNLLNYQNMQNFNLCLNSNIFISANGDVYPCMMLRDFKLGNVLKAPIHKVFQSKDYREFWELSKNKVDGCESCKYNLQCMDCRALEYYTTRKLYGMIYCDNLTTQTSKKP
jgi:radical SAM protein with 4Fe4S-binding SPASM domain